MTTRWPALRWEELPWHTSDDAALSRTARRRLRSTYRAVITPQLAGITPSLPPELLALTDEAAQELARFDGELGQELAPFAAVLLRSESASSSKIENLTASARAIAEAETRGDGKTNATMVVANQRAMSAAIELAADINARAVLQMHRALLVASEPDIAGKWRTQQVWIGGSGLSPHGATFVPPHPSRVEAAIGDLLAFIDRDDVPLLVQVALAHAQFETIHPFPDGNGRVGRALVQAHLRNKRLLRNVTVPVSAGLLVELDRYFAALTSYRDGNPAPIIEAFSNASFAAVANGRTLANELRALRKRWEGRVTARADSAAWRVLELLLRHPVVSAVLVGKELGIAPQNVYRALRPLEAAEIVIESTDKKRGQLWRAPEVLAALDRFAARAGRRSHFR